MEKNEQHLATHAKGTQRYDREGSPGEGRDSPAQHEQWEKGLVRSGIFPPAPGDRCTKQHPNIPRSWKPASSPSWWPSCHRVPHPYAHSVTLCHGDPDPPSFPPPPSSSLPPQGLCSRSSLSTLSRSLPFPRPVSFPPSDLISDLTRSLPVDVTVTGPRAVSRSCHFLPCFSRLNTISNDVFM